MVGKRILIVEDESILALDIEDSLILMGYGVVGTTSNAQEAFSMIENSPPDLVLMDVRIQGETDGIEAAHHIWERFQLPIIFLTASTDEPTLRRIYLTPAKGYVVKPFKIQELQEAIEAALVAPP
ncbi:MAG: response regulator [Leptolyngbyaceae cyanobacterium bins.59]|nr:response regulator [Leptolyngbyaceae cyanobacterium bins.59]